VGSLLVPHLALLWGDRDRRWPPVRCVSAGAERRGGGLCTDPAYVVIPQAKKRRRWSSSPLDSRSAPASCADEETICRSYYQPQHGCVSKRSPEWGTGPPSIPGILRLRIAYPYLLELVNTFPLYGSHPIQARPGQTGAHAVPNSLSLLPWRAVLAAIRPTKGSPVSKDPISNR
jgi:hypothetical protein